MLFCPEGTNKHLLMLGSQGSSLFKLWCYAYVVTSIKLLN